MPSRMARMKSVVAPRADAILLVGRDVRDVERPEGGFQGIAAAESQLVVLLGNGMAGGAAAGEEQDAAVLGVRGLVGIRSRALRRG